MYGKIKRGGESVIIAGGKLSLDENDYNFAKGKTLILKLIIDSDGLIKKSSKTIVNTSEKDK